MNHCTRLVAMVFISLTVLAMISRASADLAAQDSLVSVGERVRVSTESGETHVGLVSLATSGVIEVLDEGSASSVPLSTVTRLEVSQGRRPNAERGAVLGGLTLAFAGAVIGFSLGDDPPFLGGDGDPFPFSADAKAGIGFLLGGGAGAIMGALIGNRVQSERWEEVPLVERVSVSLAPQRYGRFALGFSVRF